MGWREGKGWVGRREKEGGGGVDWGLEKEREEGGKEEGKGKEKE